MESLQALQEIKDFTLVDEDDCYKFGELEPELIKPIEKDLKVLEQYKQLEEELGIDLITLFKALKEEIYVINENKIIAFSKLEVGYPTLLFSKHLNKWIIWGTWEDEKDVKEYVFNVKDYGKTWALTKEELEKYNDK